MTTVTNASPRATRDELDRIAIDNDVLPLIHQYDFAPSAPASLSPREAAILILHRTEWDFFLNGRHEVNIEALGVAHVLDVIRWNINGPYFGVSALLSIVPRVRNTTVAWVTSHLVKAHLCLACLDEADGDPVPYDDCLNGDEHADAVFRVDWMLPDDPDEIRTAFISLVKAEIAREQRSTR